MGIFMAIWRRLFGGYEAALRFLQERGVQFVLLTAAVFVWEYWVKACSWPLALLVGIWVYVFWSGGHFIYFKMGTESLDYIREQMAAGRRPAFYFLMSWLKDKWRLEEFGRLYCFLGMTLRYGIYALPLGLLLGGDFVASALMIPFVYAACYWVEFPSRAHFLSSPSNWGEFFSGLIIGWALW